MSEQDYDDTDYFVDGGCNRCGGSGRIVICIDDMCRGVGECMHGDGEIVCPTCNGEGAF